MFSICYLFLYYIDLFNVYACVCVNVCVFSACSCQMPCAFNLLELARVLVMSLDIKTVIKLCFLCLVNVFCFVIAVIVIRFNYTILSNAGHDSEVKSLIISKVCCHTLYVVGNADGKRSTTLCLKHGNTRERR